MIRICSFALLLFCNLALAQGPQPAVEIPMPQVLQSYQPVSQERLKNPEDGNWLMIRRTYDGWGYSPLDQITPDNVARLQPVWVFSTGETRSTSRRRSSTTASCSSRRPTTR